MQLTNNYDIPYAFEAFERANAYDRGDADISVTTLIDSPQIKALKETHDDEITEDVSDRIMSILGTAIHNILQTGARDTDIAERRLYATMDGMKISGAIDLLEYLYTDESNIKHYKLNDYKSLAGSGLIYNPDGKIEWVRQLNCYNWLASKSEFIIDELEVVAVIRDWNHAAVRRNQNFPKKAVVRVPIEMWHLEKTENYIRERVAAHDLTTPPQCTDSERWSNGIKYAVYKHKRSGGLLAKATRVFDSSVSAEAYILEKEPNAVVVERPAIDTRCVGNYCLVSSFCKQYSDNKRIMNNV